MGDEVELLPAGRVCRVRGIQVHSSNGAGRRRPAGGGESQGWSIKRSASQGSLPRGVSRATRAVDARLDYLPSSPRDLKHRSTLRLHSATFEVPAQVILIDRDILRPGNRHSSSSA